MQDADIGARGFRLRRAPAASDEENALLDAAFGMERRTRASYRLREGSAPVPGLAFHAVEAVSSRLAGVISFWPLRTWPQGGKALLLGPLAVHPDFQHGGLGSALMHAGLQAAARAQHDVVVLVGDESYYGRHGFAVVPPGQLLLPGPFDAQRLLYRALHSGTLGNLQGLLLPEWRWRRLRDARK